MILFYRLSLDSITQKKREQSTSLTFSEALGIAFVA